jgi:hypothetical protein
VSIIENCIKLPNCSLQVALGSYAKRSFVTYFKAFKTVIYQAIILRIPHITCIFTGSGNGFIQVSRYSRSAEKSGGMTNKLMEIITKQA